MGRCQIAVVGSGFAGTILARILHRLGLRVVLLERHRHPRFAIGESSTPLAAIGLEGCRGCRTRVDAVAVAPSRVG